MELKNFISESLKQIVGGVQDANSSCDQIFMLDSKGSNVNNIEFDVLVSTSDVKSTEGNGGIKILNVGLGGLIGENKEISSSSRLKFGIKFLEDKTSNQVGAVKEEDDSLRILKEQNVEYEQERKQDSHYY